MTGTQDLIYPITVSCDRWPKSWQCRISLLLERNHIQGQRDEKRIPAYVPPSVPARPCMGTLAIEICSAARLVKSQAR